MLREKKEKSDRRRVAGCFKGERIGVRRNDMKMLKICSIVLALALLPLSIAIAEDAGGFTWGEQYFDADFSNYNLQTTYSGLYGYHVTRDGQRTGGFALGLRSQYSTQSFEGGMLGAIAGQEMRAGPFLAATNLWAGIGGINANPVLGTKGGFAVFGELSVELGVRLFPGFHAAAYGGMQAIAPLGREQQLLGSILYTPVYGLRIAWGGFSETRSEKSFIF